MADKLIQMQRRNIDNTAWEKLYPATLAGNVSTTQGTTVQTQLNTITTNVSSHTGIVEKHRKITFGTADPTGGVDGDIYFQYT